MEQLSLFSEKEMIVSTKPVSIPKKAEKEIVKKRFTEFSKGLNFESAEEKADALEELCAIDFQNCVHTDLIIYQLCSNNYSFFHVPDFEGIEDYDDENEFYFWLEMIQSLVFGIDSDIKAELLKLQKYWVDVKR